MKWNILIMAVMALVMPSCMNNHQSDMETTDFTTQTIKLQAPERSGYGTVMEAFWNRRADREFDSRAITLKDMSNLLWAATGINRPETGKRTNPTAINLQEISVYVFLQAGVFLYNHTDHLLERVADGDHRDLVAAGQDFAKEAPASLVIVVDTEKFGENAAGLKLMGAADAGIVSQNNNLFCAANGMATVTRGTMDREGIVALLGLSDKQQLMLNNPLGYRKK